MAQVEFMVCMSWAKTIHPSSHPKALTMHARTYTRKATATQASDKKNISIYCWLLARCTQVIYGTYLDELSGTRSNHCAYSELGESIPTIVRWREEFQLSRCGSGAPMPLYIELNTPIMIYIDEQRYRQCPLQRA
jgi:hypothetical protein